MGDENTDNGLGLEAFVRGSDSLEGEQQAPSQESDKSTVDEKTKTETETAADTKTAATETEKTKEGDEKKPSPSDTETQIRSQVEEALKGKATETKKDPAKPDGKTKTADELAKEEQAKKTWESDENPFKRTAAEATERLSSLERQLIDTRNWATAVNQRNKLQERQLQRMEKKIDGTWDPEVDGKAEAEERRAAEAGDAVSTEQAAADAEIRGATAASLHMAYETHGKEKTDAEIKEFDSLFQRNRLIMQRVTSSKRPIQEAMKVLSEYRTAKKYGTSDLGEMITKIKEEAVAQATPALIEKITKEIMAKLSLKDKETQGIRDVRGSIRETVAGQLENGADEDDSLNKLFPN